MMVLIPTIRWPESAFGSATSGGPIRRDEWINPELITRIYATFERTNLVIGGEHIQTELTVPDLLARLGCNWTGY